MLRCPACRTRRTTYDSMQDHIKASGHKLCECGGYHYKHRPGSPYCESNVMSPLYHAMRQSDLTDDEVTDIFIDIVFDLPNHKKGTDCPF
jgi:transcriptional regulator NrdR family protein